MVHLLHRLYGVDAPGWAHSCERAARPHTGGSVCGWVWVREASTLFVDFPTADRQQTQPTVDTVGENIGRLKLLHWNDIRAAEKRPSFWIFTWLTFFDEKTAQK